MKESKENLIQWDSEIAFLSTQAQKKTTLHSNYFMRKDIIDGDFRTI